MAKQKSIDGANLQLALKQNNEKMKGYIDASHYDIKKYQKYVNTELDYCYLKVTESSKQTIEQGDIIQFSSVSETNMNVNIENCSIVLRKGKKYLLSSDIHVSGTGYVRFCFYDLTNNKILDYFVKTSNATPTSTSGKCIYIPENDCEIQIKVNDRSSSVTLSSWTWPNSYFIVQEINRQIIIDPVEHINTTQGIEDTPVGHIIAHMGTVAPKHYLICDGAEYNITDYPYLAQHIQDNFGTVNFFGGDGTVTFAVPDLRERFLKGSNSSVGENEDAGLPNITGTFSVMGNGGVTANMNVDTASGAFYRITRNGWKDTYSNETNTNKSYYAGFNASKSNSIYGNSQTVTPANTSVLYCIKYEPTYFMNTYNTNYMQPNLYSEEERIVGCWIDGKPLYEKTIKFLVNGNTVYSHNIQNVDYIFIKNFVLTESSRMFYTQNSIDAYVTTNQVALNVNSWNVSNEYAYTVLQYTKTTDEENSFTESMLKESYIKLDSTCTDEELQQAILDIVDEINAEPVVEPEQSIADIPVTIPEIYEEDEPGDEVIEEPEATPEEEMTEPEEVTPEVTDEPETEQTEVTEGGTNNESE